MLAEHGQWLPDFDALEKTDLSRVKLMWVNYTHMPTGKNADKDLFKKLIAFSKKHNILICHDNPYSFILNDNPLSILSVEGAKEHALELNSLSKTYNMAGWRIGMLAGSADTIKDVIRFKSNMDSGMFLPAQLAAVEALKTDRQWHQQNNAIYQRRKEKVLQLITNIGGVAESNQSGLFVWAKIPDRYNNAVELCDNLLYDKHVFVTPGNVFGSAGNNYFRVSLCSTENIIEQAIQRIN
jgi:aspartate/methionine/tyrosine aminotransferase